MLCNAGQLPTFVDVPYVSQSFKYIIYINDEIICLPCHGQGHICRDCTSGKQSSKSPSYLSPKDNTGHEDDIGHNSTDSSAVETSPHPV